MRKQAALPADQIIRADDPRMDEFMAMRWKGPKGFEGFFETYVVGCKEWRAGTNLIEIDSMVKNFQVFKVMNKQ